MTLSFDPILIALGAVATWRVWARPKVSTTPREPWPDMPRVPVDTPQPRVTIQHEQPDGTWHTIGHAEEGSDRIALEKSTPGRRVLDANGQIL